MDDLSKLVEQVKCYRGFSATAYRCPCGFWTIGYGYNLEPHNLNPEGLSWNEGFAFRKLREELESHHAEVLQLCAEQDVVVDSVRLMVLVAMHYYLGGVELARCNRLFSALHFFYYERAAREILAVSWDEQFTELAKEWALQMRSGCWPGSQSGKLARLARKLRALRKR